MCRWSRLRGWVVADNWQNFSGGFQQWTVRRNAEGVQLVTRWLPESEGGEPPDDAHASEPEVLARWSRDRPEEMKFEEEVYGWTDLGPWLAFAFLVATDWGA